MRELKDELISVDFDEFNAKYNSRDALSRKNMKNLIDSNANTVTKVFSTLIER